MLRFTSTILFLFLAILFCDGSQALAQQERQEVKTLTQMKTQQANSVSSGIIKIVHYPQSPDRDGLQLFAVGLDTKKSFSLMINNHFIGNYQSDANGALDINLRAKAANKAHNKANRLPANLLPISTIRNVKLINGESQIILNADILHDELLDPKALNVNDITVEANKVVMSQVFIGDADGDSLSSSVVCDKGNFVSISGLVITATPKDGDVGEAVCKLTVTDKFNLSTDAFFRVTVTPANKPPMIVSVLDQKVQVGESRKLMIQATDPNNDNLQLLVTTSVPALGGITPMGNNTFTLDITPKTENDGGKVTLQVVDAGGLTASTSFSVVVQKVVTVTMAQFLKPMLFISGSGFGGAGAKVMVNGTDISSFSVGQSNNSITLKGNKKKLNIKKGANQVIVTVGGIASNSYVFMQ